MSKRKAEKEKEPEQAQVPDWLDQLVDEIYAKPRDGRWGAPCTLLPPGEAPGQGHGEGAPTVPPVHKGEQANGFYRRKLHLTLGKLNLKVPRVRYARSFRPDQRSFLLAGRGSTRTTRSC